MASTIQIKGMFGTGKTYFNGSPVVIDITGLQWSGTSPFNIVRIDVADTDGKVIGDFHADTGGQSSISFDIQSALRSLWSDYDYSKETAAAAKALAATSKDGQAFLRKYRSYTLKLRTEYLDSKDQLPIITESQSFTGGQCMIGALTEWERYNIDTPENADASHWQNSNLRNGDASTKPTSTPERVGKSSITSWVDVNDDGTTSVFFPAAAPVAADVADQHAPIVLRDTQDYRDFLFVNRRGAVETASALMMESLEISIDSDTYNRVERPTFKPTRSIMEMASGGRRSWGMSSGYVDRYWAEWWVREFLQSSRHWMLIDGKYVPVTVSSEKKSVSIYNKAKQDLAHVDFTVALALEG